MRTCAPLPLSGRVSRSTDFMTDVLAGGLIGTAHGYLLYPHIALTPPSVTSPGEGRDGHRVAALFGRLKDGGVAIPRHGAISFVSGVVSWAHGYHFQGTWREPLVKGACLANYSIPEPRGRGGRAARVREAWRRSRTASATKSWRRRSS